MLTRVNLFSFEAYDKSSNAKATFTFTACHYAWTVVTRKSVKMSFEVCIFTVDFQYIIRFVMYSALAAEF